MWYDQYTSHLKKEGVFLKHLRQLAIILAAYFLGVILQWALNLPIPGTVLGLIILFLALSFGIVKTEMIEDVCDVLISHMSFLFVPAGVGLMTALGLLSGKLIQFFIIIFISTSVVFIVTASTVKFLRKACSK
jgi:holin-like protein